MRLAVPRILEIVGAQRGTDDAQPGTQDAILVETGHVLEQDLDRRHHRSNLLRARLRACRHQAIDEIRRQPGRDRLGDQCTQLGSELSRGLVRNLPALLARRVEAGLEQLDQQAGNRRIAVERFLHVALRERHARLQQIFAIAAQHGDLPPRQARTEHELVERIVLGVAAPDLLEGRLEGRRDLCDVERTAGLRLHDDVLDAQLRITDIKLVELLGEHGEIHVLQQRNHLGQGDVGAVAENLEMQRVRIAGGRRQAEPDVVAPLQLCGQRDIGGSAARRGGLDVFSRQGGVTRGELAAFGIAPGLDQRVTKFVVPVAHDVRDPALDGGQIVIDGLPGIGADHQMQQCQWRLADLDRGIDLLAMQRLAQRSRDAFAHGRGQALARQIDQAGIKPPVLVAAHEQLGTRARAQRQDTRGQVVQVAFVGLQQFVARQQFKHMAQRLARMRIAAQSRALQDAFDLASHQWHVLRSCHVGVGGEQAKEPLLGDRHSGLVEAQHADVVHVAWAMHAGARIGLGQDDRVHRTRLRQVLCDQGAQRARRLRTLRTAQNALARFFHRLQHFVVADPGDFVFAVAQEGEVVIDRPAQEFLRLGHPIGGDRQLALRQVVGDAQHRVAHCLPVADAGAHIGQHTGKVGFERTRGSGIGHAVDFHMHDRLGRAAVRDVAIGHALQLPRCITPDADHRMDERMHGKTGIGDRHADRIDEKRHVVGDHVDERTRTATAADVLHPDFRRLRRALADEGMHLCDQRRPRPRLARLQVLDRHALQKGARELRRIGLTISTDQGGKLRENRVELRAARCVDVCHGGVRM